MVATNLPFNFRYCSLLMASRATHESHDTLSEPTRDTVRGVLECFGGPPLSYYALLPDKSYFCSKQLNSVISYVDVGRTRVALGDPMGPSESAVHFITQFMDYTRKERRRLVHYQVTDRMAQVFRELGYACTKIGEDAVVQLSQFNLKGKRFQDLRTANNKMNRLSVTCEELRLEAVDQRDFDALSNISSAWLRAQKARELTFSMGCFKPESALFNESRTFVGRDHLGQIIGFITFVPIFGASDFRRGWGLDLMRANGEVGTLIEYLISSAMTTFASERAEIVSLGLSALAGSLKADPWATQHAYTSRAIDAAYNRCNRVYSFKGLHAFKDKFGPDWEPRYLVCRKQHSLLPSVYAVLRAHRIREY